MNKELILFRESTGNDVTFEDLLRTIYENVESKRIHIFDSADKVKEKIKTVNDAVILGDTLIKLQEAAIKNDEQLIKMANIVSRTMKTKSSDDNVISIDRNALLEEIRKSRQIASEIPHESA